MTRTAKALLLLFFFSLCAAAIMTHRIRFEAPPPGAHQLFAIVEQHFTALRVADYSSAYRCAASGVQQTFTRAQYEAMIRRDYADIARGQRIEFGFVRVSGSSAVVQVFFRGAGGSVRVFLYSLIAEGAAWKINGLQPVRSAPRGHETGLHI
jgi:hypothetical protein